MPKYKYEATEPDYSVEMGDEDRPMRKPKLHLPVSSAQVKEADIDGMIEVKLTGKVVGMESRKGGTSYIEIELESSDVYGTDKNKAAIDDMMDGE